MDLRLLRDYMYGIWIGRQIEKFHKQGGKVVVITGSYGKTSVKELSYDLLRHKYQTVETSGNYNTIVGIAKTIYYEVLPQTKVVIFEVGAYHVGEIMNFCRILKPDVGVVTGIARQHLERFGSWEKIIEAKTELARYIEAKGGVLIANGSDETVKVAVKEATWYSGKGRVEVNKNGAKEVARAMGMSKREIEARAKYFRLVPNRFELTTERYGMLVIDDAYNSNEKSFSEAVEYLGRQKTHTRVLVTPGLLELGSESAEIHEQLGKELIGKVDIVILVGKNERTKSLEMGMNGKVEFRYINKTLEFMKTVKQLKLKKEPLVLLENDVKENH